MSTKTIAISILFLFLSSCSPSTTVTTTPESPVIETPTIIAEIEPTTERPDPNRMHVTFLNPGISDVNDPTGGFWLSVSSFMMATAADLDIDLEIIYSERNHLLMHEQAFEVLARPYPPDYLLVVNEKLAADVIVQAANEAGVKTFVVLNTFTDEQKDTMGVPREMYEYWIGSLVPDNHAAGYTIARSIFDSALKTGVTDADGQVHLVAVTGDYVTPASIQRSEGLEEALTEYPNVILEQTFVGEWRQDIAQEQISVALQRYPETSVIWAANDPMALGAIDAILETGQIPGKDVIIGGLNWDQPALEKIKEGELQMSVGGHFMTGGWALILLYDYHYGQDFAPTEGVELTRQIFSVVDDQNIDLFLTRFGDRNWDAIDFTLFSKVYHPELETYDFSLEAILSQ